MLARRSRVAGRRKIRTCRSWRLRARTGARESSSPASGDLTDDHEAVIARNERRLEHHREDDVAAVAQSDGEADLDAVLPGGIVDRDQDLPKEAIGLSTLDSRRSVPAVRKGGGFRMND